jgi:hypothetical protein
MGNVADALSDPGHTPCQLRLIMRPVPHKGQPVDKLHDFLAYVQRFDVVPPCAVASTPSSIIPRPDPVPALYHLKRALRIDGTRKGDIVPLSQCQAPIDVTPLYPQEADRHLSSNNCLEISTEFWLNIFFDKEPFYTFFLSEHL